MALFRQHTRRSHLGTVITIGAVLLGSALAGCGPVESPPRLTPTTSSTAVARTSGAPMRTTGVGSNPMQTPDLQTELAAIGVPADAQDVRAAADRLSAAVSAEIAGGRAEQVRAKLSQALDTALSTSQGRQAVAEAGRVLSGHAFKVSGAVTGAALGETGSDDSNSASNVPATAQAPGGAKRLRMKLVAQTEPLKIYFVNGIMNTYPEAVFTAGMLHSLFGRDVVLIYNESAKELWSMDLKACIRALDRARIDGELIATDATWGSWLKQKLHNTLTPGLRAACKAVDGAVTGVQAGMSLMEAGASLLELSGQWFSDRDADSAVVNDRLVPMVEQDIVHGSPVLLIGHSQGTMFVRNALNQVRQWWDGGGDGHHKAPCEGALTPNDEAPVGALYISPAFGMTNTFPLQQYVLLHGDVLSKSSVSGSEPTAEPTAAQIGNKFLTSLTLHEVLTYLMPHTGSLDQVIRGAEIVFSALSELQGVGDCATGTTVSTAETSAETSAATSGADVIYQGEFVPFNWRVVTYQYNVNEVTLTVHPDGSADGQYTLGWTEDDTYLWETPSHCLRTLSASGTLRLEAGQHSGTIENLQEIEPTKEGCKAWTGTQSHSKGTWELGWVTPSRIEDGGVDVYATGVGFELTRQ